MGAKERNRNYVLNSTKEIFLKRGIIGVSMADIANEVNFGVASLYRYFGNRESLIIECAVSLWNDRFQKVKTEYDKNINLSGFDQLLELTKYFPWLIVSDKDFLRVLSSLDVLFANNDISDIDRKKYNDSMVNIYKLFKSAYEKGLKDGSIREIPNFELFYFTTMNAMLSLSQKLVSGEVILDEKRPFEDVINMMINIITAYAKQGK